eukprot:scaffold4882_cov70-Phaeocystis_antarctica.AAC.6
MLWALESAMPRFAAQIYLSIYLSVCLSAVVKNLQLRTAAEWRKNKLTASEYDETTWSARTWMAFVTQRLSVAAQLSMAQEVAEALSLSVAADPRAQ